MGEVIKADSQEVQNAKLIVPTLVDLYSVLEELGAPKIDDRKYIDLLRYCRNESLKDCVSSLDVLLEGGLKRVKAGDDQETLNLLSQFPCWWTDDGEARQLNDLPPLLWGKPDKWPNWLKVKMLHREFREKIEDWENKQEEVNGRFNNSKLKKWQNLINNHLSRKNENYIDWVLLPYIKSWEKRDWEKLGFDVLMWLMLWESQHEFKKTTPYIRGAENNEEERRRNALATTLRLPTDKGWLPAIDCFTGTALDGPKAFDTFYRDRTGYGIVRMYEDWPNELRETDKGKWKGLLRWVGVSWEPKVCRTQNFEIQKHLHCTQYFSTDDAVTLKGGWNYFIKDFPDCLSGIRNDDLLQNIFPALLSLSKKKAQRYWRRPAGNRQYNDLTSAFAFEQLCKEEWLPVKKSLLEGRAYIPPKEVFLPGNGLNGLLPEVDKAGIDDDTWHGNDGIKAKLIELGVMWKLPESAPKWHEWMRKLTEKGRTLKQEDRKSPVDWKDSGAKDLWRATRSLYRGYLQTEISRWPLKDVEIPCVCFKDSYRILDFAHPEQVYWIDQPHLADVTLENKLLSKGYKLFIFRLQETAEVSKLRVKKLSNVVECKPQYSECGSTGYEEYALYQRFKARRIVLNKVKNIQLPEEVDIKAVANLTLKLSTNGYELGDCSILSWKEKETECLLVDIEKNKWRALADALAHRLYVDGRYSQFANDFEVYLADDDNDSILERMRSVGIPEEALEEVKKSISSLNGSPSRDKRSRQRPG